MCAPTEGDADKCNHIDYCMIRNDVILKSHRKYPNDDRSYRYITTAAGTTAVEPCSSTIASPRLDEMVARARRLMLNPLRIRQHALRVAGWLMGKFMR